MAVLSLASVECIAAPIALGIHLEGAGVMAAAVDSGHGGGFVGGHSVPLAEAHFRRKGCS